MSAAAQFLASLLGEGAVRTRKVHIPVGEPPTETSPSEDVATRGPSLGAAMAAAVQGMRQAVVSEILQSLVDMPAKDREIVEAALADYQSRFTE